MAQKQSRINKKNILNALLLIIVTGLVLYFSLKDDFFTTIHEIITLNLFWFIIATCAFLTSLWLRSYSMYFMVKKYHQDYTVKKSHRLILLTQFFNAVTPFATGGQPFQVYTLKKDGIKIADGTTIIVQNFIVYQIALVLLGLIAVGSNYFFHIFKANPLLKHLTTLGFMINVLVVLVLFIVIFAKKFNDTVIRWLLNVISKFNFISTERKEKLLLKVEDTTRRFYTGGKNLLQDKKLFILTIILNLIGLTCLYLVPLFILYAMGDYTSVSPFIAVISSAYVMLIGAFVPIPGGTGGLEYSYIEFFGNFLHGGKLRASMLLWRFVTYYFGMFIGALTLNIKERRK